MVHGSVTNPSRKLEMLLSNVATQDLRDFAAKQYYISQIVRPPWMGGKYINLRSSATAYFSHLGRPLGTANISSVLDALGLEPFQGRQHSGIDDVKNIARILQELVRPERIWKVSANASIRGKDKRWAWMTNSGKVTWNHPPGN